MALAVSAYKPDVAALYARHGATMRRVAAAVLRGAGLESQAQDAVHDAIESIMKSPPPAVRDWEAFLVTAVTRKALDRIRSADVRHAGPSFDEAVHDHLDSDIDISEAVATALDQSRRAGIAWDCLSVLDDRQRKVVWDIAALERSRSDVAAELGVTPPRVSQIMTRALALLEEEITKREGGTR
jgi:RNA polymerase sigma factor (sigma-70 family)